MNALTPNLFAFDTNYPKRQVMVSYQPCSSKKDQEVLDKIHAHQKWLNELADAKIAFKVWSILYRFLKFGIFKGLIEKAQQRLKTIQQQSEQHLISDYEPLIDYLVSEFKL